MLLLFMALREIIFRRRAISKLLIELLFMLLIMLVMGQLGGLVA
jgi:hypothetical protein